MKVDFMRFVDRYVGVPICFILSIFDALFRVKTEKPKKILFIELSEMGSTILAYSAMKKAKEMFNAELYFMIFKENEQSVMLLDIIPKKNIITISSKSLFAFAFGTLKAIFKVRKFKIDTVIDLELFSRFTAILSYFSGAGNRVGLYSYNMEGLYRGTFQTHKVEYNPYYHISQMFMALVYSLKEDVDETPLVKKKVSMSEIKPYRIISNIADKKRIIDKLRRINPNIKGNIVLLNPNASQLLPIRKWPNKNYQKLARELLDKTNAYIVIVGVESEKPDAVRICNYVNNPRCIDFTGKTTLKELVDLYNISRVIVSNDSGPAHFASLTGIRIVVLFGPETPNLYAPLGDNTFPIYADFACSPCVSAFNHRKTPCKISRCLDAIKVSQVFSAVKPGLR